MKLFKRKPKTAKKPMTMRAKRVWVAIIAIIGSVVSFGLVAPAAQAATMSACYILAAGPDNHRPYRHGDVYASVDYTWAEEVFLGQKDGYRFFGSVDARLIDTRPYWINGC